MIRFYLGQYAAENIVIKALYDACPEKKWIGVFSEYKPSDVAVVMGVYKKFVKASYGRGEVIKQQQAAGKDCLILETGYINRGDSMTNHYALGWNGLNGRADFKNHNMPSDRSAKLGHMKEWRGGSHVLLCGQVPWDASCDFTDHVQWLNEAAMNIRAVSKRKVIFRPHPKAPVPKVGNVTYSSGGPIEGDLKDAHCCVTFNSNSGVDALINGVPLFAFDVGAMGYQVANRNWLSLEKPDKPDRSQWYNDLAYAQWRPDEFVDAWKHVLRHTDSKILSQEELCRA